MDQVAAGAATTAVVAEIILQTKKASSKGRPVVGYMEIEIKKDLLDINLSNSSPVVESLASQVVVGTIIVGTGSSIKGR